MDKIRYILDLTGITLPESARGAAEDKIRNAGAVCEKKKRKKTAAAVLAALPVFAALVIAVCVIVPNARKSSVKADGSGTGAALTVTDEETTDEPAENPSETLYFTPLYEADSDYDAFRTAARLLKPAGDGVIVAADDLSPFYEYFGEAKPSAEILCSTFFAGYEKEHVIFSAGVSARDGEAYENKKELDAAAELPEGYHAEEMIVLTSKNGTFEYLLTVSVVTDKSPGAFSEKGTRIYDQKLNPIGEYGGKGYMLKPDDFSALKTNVYKIRFEMELPVIYAKYTIPREDPSPEHWFAAAALSYGAKLWSAALELDGAVFEFKNEQNVMMQPTFTKASAGISDSSDLDVAALCDYQYSFASYGENGLCGRAVVTRIINEMKLQWFFPMYAVETDEGTVIVGEGIKEGCEVFSSESFVSSSLKRIYGTEYENNKYTPYFSGGSENSVSLAYIPYYCDKPYFDESYFGYGDHPFIKLLVKDKEITSIEEFADPDALKDFTGPSKEFEDSLYRSYYPYIRDLDCDRSPSCPFASEFLPFLSEDIDGIPQLFTALGLSLPQTKRFDNFDNKGLGGLTLGLREIHVTSVKMDGVRYTGAGDNGDAVGLFTVTAYEDKNGYIIDTAGRISGLRGADGVYEFNTFEACYDITVKAVDGRVVYAYFGDTPEEYRENSVSVMKTETLSGIMPETIEYYMKKNVSWEPVYEIAEEEYDPDTDSYRMTVETVRLPDKRVLPVRGDGEYAYNYYANLIMYVKDGGIRWSYTDEKSYYLSSSVLSPMPRGEMWSKEKIGCDRFVLLYRDNIINTVD